MKVLIIDDESGIRVALGHFLRSRGYEIFEAATASQGLAIASETLPDLIFLDQRLPDMDGEDLLPMLTAPEIDARVVMMTAYAELHTAVRAMKSGAEYFFPKPFDLAQVTTLLENIERQVRLKQEVLHYRQLFEESDKALPLIGFSPSIIRVQRLISLLAMNPSTPVLILGESGSGKELAARSIHLQSGISGPLVEINSASLSETLLESELFGHEKGAFTDAAKTKQGLFELADNGTIFFDELAEMPLPIQAKLLKVLDTRFFRRVGGVVDMKTTARFIGATNRNIVDMVKKGLFREDLYYRINVMPITMPPLRARGRDIVLLAEHFIKKLAQEMGRGSMEASAQFLEALCGYGWPGNVRELKNIIERALILSTTQSIDKEHLPPEFRSIRSFPENPKFPERLQPLKDIEAAHIEAVLTHTGNNHSRTADILGISRSTLLAKLKKRDEGVQ